MHAIGETKIKVFIETPFVCHACKQSTIYDVVRQTILKTLSDKTKSKDKLTQCF